MSFKEVMCPNCLKSVPVDSNQNMAFCVYCGKKLPVAENMPDSESREDWDRLFEQGQYSKVLYSAASHMQKDEEEAEPRVYYLLALLKQLYVEYHKAIGRENEEKTLSQMIGSLFFKRADNGTSFHAIFSKNAIQLADELAALLDNIKNEQPVLCRTAAAKAVDLLVFRELTHFDNSESTNYQMLEKRAIPFFALLSDQELERQYAFYQTVSKQRFFGKEILRAMRKERKLRNIS